MSTVRARSHRALSLRLLVALGVAVIATAGPFGDVSIAQAATPVKLGTSTTFYGRGWGHGVGMSQYGARGRALAGQKAITILHHYYTGTTLGSKEPTTPIRVLVMAGFSPTDSRPFRIYGRGGSWFISGRPTVYPADAVLQMSHVPIEPGSSTLTWRTTIKSASGAVLFSKDGLTDLKLRPKDATTRLQLWSKPTSYDRYRGSLRVVATASIKVVNTLGLDTYLRGVVPAEMPASWPTEALRAQAIAARSYAARVIRTAGDFDVFDDTRSQVYRGLLVENATTDKAITATRGDVVKYGGVIAQTFFHSTAGGWTEDNEKAWVSSTGKQVAAPVAYLRGVSDRRSDGTSYDDSSPYATWHTKAYSKTALTSIFGADSRTAVGTLSSLDLSDRGVSGRLISVILVGSSGSKTVSGDVFRAVFNVNRPAADPPMYSTLFDLAAIP